MRTILAALAVTGLVATSPSAVATNPEAAAKPLATPESAQELTAEVTVKMPGEVADRLGTGRTELIDAVATDVLSQSHDAVGLTPAKAVSELAAENREVVVDVRTVSAGWARGVAYVEASRAEHGHPEGWLFIAHRENGRWVSGLEGDREFADYVATSPLVGETEREYMMDYVQRQMAPDEDASPIEAAANTGGLLLPWMPDHYMTVTGGPHSHTGGAGHWSSLDFAGGNASGRVRSSREGTATSMCGAGGGWTRVIHPGGFSTDYYHMFNTVYYNGTSIGSSALLGTIGTDLCAGGSATGPHVHWSLRTYDANLNGQYTWLNGRTIGGWTWRNGASQYTGCGARLGYSGCPGTAIYNRTS